MEAVLSEARPHDVIDGRYRVDRELSRGGMGRVYAATHVHLGTTVAVKLLDGDESPKDRERFLQEARAAAQLRHPNVVQVTDFGIDRDQPYLVMELLEGETLRSRLDRDRTLDPETTATVIDGIGRALTAAHAAGIVHRDLKPENVFVSQSGVVKVLDFGIAKVATATSALTTSSGAVLGTPAYMSPEQAQGSRDVDASSDLWALGVIAYECLVGARPFDADALGELVLQICAWPMPTPSQHGAVPPEFDAWFANACMRDRDLRFGSAAVQASALARVCAERPVHAQRARADTGTDTPREGVPTARIRDDASGRATTPLAAVEEDLATPRVVAPPRRLAPVIALAVVAAALLCLVIWRLARTAETPVTSPVTTPAPATTLKIAVLPRDDSTAAELVPSADTVTEELIARLAGRPGLRVIARTSITNLRGKPRGDLAATARTLGADQLLIARLERTGDRLKLALELIAADQTVTWAQIYTRSEAELESVCALAASDLATAVGAPRAGTSNVRPPAAFRAYRTGRDYWYRRDHDSLKQAIKYFEEALRIDPDYTSAWVGLVDANLLLPWMGTTPRPTAYAAAKTALDRALALAPDTSEVQAARGNYLVEAEWRFAEAERAYRRAIELDPDNANAHQWLAEVLGFSRRFDEALAELRLAEQLDPLISAIHKIRARTLYHAGRFGDAVAAVEATLSRDPNQPWVSYGKGYALVRLERYDEGLAAIMADPMMQLPGIEPIVKAQEMWVAWRRGDRATAEQRAREIGTKLMPDAPFVEAFVAAMLDDRPRLYAALARGIEVHDPWMPMILIIFEFDPFRSEPAFQKIVENFRL